MDGDRVIIEVEDVSFSYPFGGNVLDRLSFHLHEREKVGLIGPNGSGKSTLLHILMGLVKPSGGTLRLFGRRVETEKDFFETRKKTGLLFQNADDQLFSPTGLEDVAFGPLNLGKSPKEAREMAVETLEKLDLHGFEDRITHKLSGGEKKLVAMATVLVMDPKVLFFDEPTTGLDEKTNQRIMSILNSLDISYVIVSHEYDFLARTTQSIYSMADGKIQYNGDSAALHSHYHIHPAGETPHKHSHHSHTDAKE